MLGLLIRKELLENLLNLRFIALCVVAIVLLVSSIVVLTGQYRDELNFTRTVQPEASVVPSWVGQSYRKVVVGALQVTVL